MSSDHHTEASTRGQLKIFSELPPSEAMESAWTISGSLCAVECMCGRVHFLGRGTSHGDYEPGELKALEASARIDPAGYIQITTYDSIDSGHLSGRQVVLGCPCHALTRYEAFLLGHRWQILRFFKNLADEKTKAAGEAAEVAGGVAAALETIEAAGGEP